MAQYNSILGQMLDLIPRYEFEKSVLEHKTEKHAKGFSSWTHFVSMLFAQVSGQNGLRGIEASLASQQSKLYHLGIGEVKRSTLSYANNHRTHEAFKSVFESVLEKTTFLAPKHKFKFKNKLYSLDATTIDLCLSLHDWATFRKAKGGIKLHVQLDHSGYIPKFVILTPAIEHEGKQLARIKLKKDDVIVFDRGYYNFVDFANLCNNGIYFVTRQKVNADYKVVARNDTSNKPNISSDQIIQLAGFYSKQKCPYELRRIRVKDPETGKHIVILTNNFKWSASTIAAIYKDRWQIEIFFKTMKQKMKVKSFLGTSKNAILNQIWTALIAYLLASYLKFTSKTKWTINMIMDILPTILFARRCLWTWLTDPGGKSETQCNNSIQLDLI